MSDQEIYQEIAQLLIGAGPSEARRIVVRAELFSAGDGGGYEFDYVDAAGELNWFDPDGRAAGDLTELLVRLRNYFVSNNFNSELGAWNFCKIDLCVEGMKFRINFSY